MTPPCPPDPTNSTLHSNRNDAFTWEVVDRDGGGRVPAEGGRAYEGENTFGYVDKYSLDAYSLRIDNK